MEALEIQPEFVCLTQCLRGGWENNSRRVVKGLRTDKETKERSIDKNHFVRIEHFETS
jgi:hypothetical protein